MTQFNLRRSSLFDDLFREMEANLGARVARGPQPTGVYPPVNLDETSEAYILTAELPGIASDEIDVSIEGSTITLTGQRKTESKAGDGVAVHRRERQSGHFKRAFQLPGRIDVDSVEAVHRAGVLELRLPKAPETKPRQISIETR
jgi:HSP20 family protein